MTLARAPMTCCFSLYPKATAVMDWFMTYYTPQDAHQSHPRSAVVRNSFAASVGATFRMHIPRTLCRLQLSLCRSADFTLASTPDIFECFELNRERKNKHHLSIPFLSTSTSATNLHDDIFFWISIIYVWHSNRYSSPSCCQTERLFLFSTFPCHDNFWFLFDTYSGGVIMRPPPETP